MLDRQRIENIEMLTVVKVSLFVFSLMVIYDYYYMTTPVVVRIENPWFSLNGPYNTSIATSVDDQYERLFDIKNFTFIVNPQPCKEYTAGLLLMIIVSSNPVHFDKRMVIRSTWGRSSDSTKVVFLLGETSDKEVAARIDNESSIHGDIVQGNFGDAYRNMSYKHVMGLKWVSFHCPMARYVLKTDDDIVVNSHALRHFLVRELSPWGAKGLITCEVLKRSVAQRSPKSKWMVSSVEYPDRYYPTYCSGWGILYSQDVIPRLLKAAQNTPYFWIDDVLITGILANKIGVARTPLPGLIMNLKRANMLTTLGSQRASRYILGPPEVSASKISEIWKAIPA